ncbi:MAG: hypothetical protein JRH11_09395 [Deltaproteobacteria bacterium]|nr:hypothetical protein [Deltaproteobacteria bacterium]
MAVPRAAGPLHATASAFSEPSARKQRGLIAKKSQSAIEAFTAWGAAALAPTALLAGLRRKRVVARLRDEASRPATWATLQRALRRAEARSNHDRYAQILLRTIAALSGAGHHEDVLQILDDAHFDRVSSRGHRYLAVYGALAHLQLGQVAEARNILDGVDGTLDGAWEEWHLALDAVAAAAVGRRREATALASWISDERYAHERTVAQAHTLAAAGRRVEAQRALMRLQSDHDDPRLQSLQFVPGPATALATAVVMKKGSPFR